MAKKMEGKKAAKSKNGAFKRFAQERIARLKKRYQSFMSRRPHRSFRRTRRRDYERSLDLPGYWAFTYTVWQFIWRYRTLMASFVVVYSLIALVSVGLMSEDSYSSLSSIFFGGEGEAGVTEDFGTALSSIAIFAATVGASLTHQLSDTQQVMGGFIALMGWLTVVWIVRKLLAGNSVRLRDAIYTSGAPIAATLILMAVLLFQLIPLAMALIAYNVAASNGLFINGVEAMVVWSGIVLVALLSLYWMCSTVVAMVIVTLPGVYPLEALKTAGDLVVGRRLRLAFRLGWLLLWILPAWGIILIPMIIIQGMWLQSLTLLVPVTALLLSSLTLLWSAVYVYMIYRKLLDDQAPPA